MLTRISVKNQRTYYWWVLPVIPWPSASILMIFFKDISCSPNLHIPRTNDGFPRSRTSCKASWKYPTHTYHLSIQQPLTDDGTNTDWPKSLRNYYAHNADRDILRQRSDKNPQPTTRSSISESTPRNSFFLRPRCLPPHLADSNSRPSMLLQGDF
jgi:hypothetical protein